MNEPTTYVLEYAARQIANVEGLPALATFLVWDDLTTIWLKCSVQTSKRNKENIQKLILTENLKYLVKLVKLHYENYSLDEK